MKINDNIFTNILASFLISIIAINYSVCTLQFKFDVMKYQITQNGNLIIGSRWNETIQDMKMVMK